MCVLGKKDVRYCRFFATEKCRFKLGMITKADHQKVTYLQAQESESESDSDSKLKFESPIQLGTRMTQVYYNRVKEAEFINPVIINGIDDWINLLEEILSTDSRIQIKTIKEDWDDIPSPPEEDLDQAIQIMDQIKLPDPIFPKVQETGQPSWD